MDSNQFDRFTRRLTERLSRRGLGLTGVGALTAIDFSGTDAKIIGTPMTAAVATARTGLDDTAAPNASRASSRALPRRRGLMSWSRVLLLVLIISLAAPSALLGTAPGQSPATGLTDTVAAPRAPGPSAAEMEGPHLKGEKKRDKGEKKKRKQEARKDDRAKKSRHEPETETQAPPPRLPEQSRQGTSSEPSKQERKRLWEKKCAAPGSVKLSRSRECTHGGDPAPPGFEITRRVAPLAKSAARSATAGVECDGDGQSGPRIQVLYAHASNVSSRYNAFLPSFRAWTADADTMLQESAAEAGGSRHFRLATTGCVIDVTEVTLTPAGDGDFDNTIGELKAQGYDRGDRKYLIYVDTISAGICGIGSIWDDDDPGQANWNNYGPSYARVDAGCWDGFTAAHEVMHNLGGVQLSSPNTSGGFHCIDEYDIMCYSDEPHFPTMRIDCPEWDHELRFDCGHDDYFHPAPANGAYLNAHWNAADNRFLIGGGNGGEDDGAPPAISWVAPVADGETYRAASGSVALQATASDGGGINRVQFWRLDESSDEWVLLATDRAAPYTTNLAIADLDLGMNYLTVDAYDGVRNMTFTYIWIERTATPPPEDALTITAPRNGAKIKAKKSVTLSARASNALAGVTGVEFRVCIGGSCAWSAGRSLGTDAGAPFNARWKAPKSGSATFLTQVTHDDGTELSDPVTVSVKKAKAKKKKKR